MSGPDCLTRHRVKSLNVCGFVHSGKGALIDYFSSCPEVMRWPGGETRFVRCPGGIYYLDRWFQDKGALSFDDIMQFARLANGKLEEGTEERFWNNKDEKTWCNMDCASIRNEFGSSYDLVCDEYARDLLGLFNNPRHWFDRKYFIDISRKFTAALTDLASLRPGKKIMMYDNGFHAFMLNLAEFFSDIIVIAAIRDPRDQYVEIKSKFPHMYQTVNAFVAEFKSARKEYKNAEDRLFSDGARELLAVNFEDFILNENYRAALCLKVGVERPLEGDGCHFNPKKSVHNIGVFRHHENLVDDIKYIEDNLTDHLFISGVSI